MKRPLYFISDGTGITAEALGHALITQFEDVQFDTKSIPYIKTPEQAIAVVEEINAMSHSMPLVFSSIVNKDLRQIILGANAIVYDFFDAFLDDLSQKLNAPYTQKVGASHGLSNYAAYEARINAINYTLKCDDGQHLDKYQQADVILIGVSRSGKTPTSLYLAIQSGLCVANYPMTEDDMEKEGFPSFIKPHKDKIFALLITPEKLHAIRTERYGNSRYAQINQCEKELAWLRRLVKHYQLPHTDSTNQSIEEISTKVMAKLSLQKKF